ncbi:hypothetical protein [Micrococcus sp. IITD107]|uniref:hypothetical protein n=1 Tax=Micrococcus sp. IITD107 TaxID=3342790 RepID=UPI0035BB1BAA
MTTRPWDLAPGGPSVGLGEMVPSALPVDRFCDTAHGVAQLIAPEESVLRVLEAAVAQLHQVAEELRGVAAGTRQMGESVGQLLTIDWRSPAGEAFVERTGRMRLRAGELAEVAEELVLTSRAAIDELQHRIDQTRQNIAVAKATAVTVLSGGVC